MKNYAIIHIKTLVQVEHEAREWVAGADMAHVDCLHDAYLVLMNGIIHDFGSMQHWPEVYHKLGNIDLEILDATGKLVYPAFADSHTHLVYAGSREIEYMDKIRGLSYEEIAKRGGGILNSAKRLHEASEQQLFDESVPRIYEIMQMGTGAVEIKSGYGLNTEDELKMLRVIRRLKEETPITIKSTFLGAHAIPLEYKGRQEEYVDLIINEMIPLVAAEELADYVDVFCDKGFFTPYDTERILMAGLKYGMKPKIHANELDFSGGVQVGVKYGALSVDHLEFIGEDETKVLLNSQTMPTVLPGAAFFLGMQYSPVRKMMQAGLPIALASDFNPGSSPSGNMHLISAMGCILYKMLPQEVIHATTINGAYAMELSHSHGSICKGKAASVFITKPMPGIEFFPYAYGSNLIDTVFVNGVRI